MALIRNKSVAPASRESTVSSAGAITEKVIMPVDVELPTIVGQPVSRHARETLITKDDYWRRREERDIQKEDRQVQRDKDMAWSGLAQAVIQSVGIIQFNTAGTVEGLVELTVRVTDLLLQARDKRNG